VEITRGPKAMIKLWQKTTLSVMVGTAIYSLFLTHLIIRTKQSKELAAVAQEKQVERTKLLKTISEEKHNLLQLNGELHQLQAHTSTVEKQINQVKTQIQQIQAGITSAQIQLVKISNTPSTQSVSQVSVPIASQPSVQSVTTASGKK
jgi:septal ring factor EnvC (AmiA/AmiB activator)